MSGRRTTSWSISSLFPNGAPVVEYSGIRVSTSQFDVPVQLFWGQRRLTTNLIDYIDFQANSVNSKGKGGGPAKSQKQYDYVATVLLGLGEGTVDSIKRCFVNGSTSTTASLAQLNATFFSGTSSQTAWSVVTSDPRYSSHAMTYRFTSYLGVPQLDLGYSPTVPDMQPEAKRANGFSYTHTTNGWINPVTNVQDTDAFDVLPSDCVYDLLSNSRYGMGFVSGDFTSNLSFFATYCRAQGIFFSPCLTNQEKATQTIDRWAQFSNTWIFWNGTQIDFCPLGDTAVTGNGVTYTPNNTPVASLGLSDFLGDPPVTVTRKDPADCYNRTRLTFTDRTLGYISNDVEYKDQTLVDEFGLRDSASSSADEICDPPVANIVAQLVGKRAANIRNTYKWKASFRQILLLPGDIVLLTEPNIGLSGTAVRITSVTEDEDSSLEFDAEEYPGIVGHYASFVGGVASTSLLPDMGALPSSVNTPAIIEPSSAFTNGTPTITIAASGTTNWGGCVVYVSHDNVNYSPIGEITAAAIQGTLTANLASHSDPDTTNTLSVDTTESGIAVPTSITNADADADRSLCLVTAQPTVSGSENIMPVNGELLSIGAVSATGTFTSNCTYLRRGQYGTSPSSHSSGDQFTIIDVLGVSGTSVIYTLPPLYIGQKIYFKLASFNQFHTSEQSLAACTEYSYTPTGLGYGTAAAGVPATPTGLSALSVIGAVTLTWNANPTIDNVNEYLVYRANGSGASFGSATLITEVSALTWTDTTTAGGSSYTYFLEAENNAGSSGPTAGVSATVSVFNVPVVTASLGSISSPVQGDLAFLTTDNQLYRYTGSAWTVAVPAVNITGTIVNAQVANGAIDAANLGPGSVTASKLFVGGVGAALNTDPGTSDNSAWGSVSPYTNWGITLAASFGGPAGPEAIYSNTSGSALTAWVYGLQSIPVDTTKTYRVRCWWNSFSSCNGGFYLGVRCLDGSGALISDEWWAANDIAAVTSWTETLAVFGAGTSNTFPSGTVSMQVEIVLNWGGSAGYMLAQDIRIEEVLPSTLIQDGSIVTSKIAADAVTAGQIDAGAVTSGTIAANAVTAGTIASNAVTAGTIAAGAINVGTEIVNNLIVTGHIQNGAVTAQLQLAASSVLLPSSGASTTMLTGSLTVSGNSALTLISAHFNNQAYFEFDIDGVAQWNGSTSGAYQLDSQGYPGAQLFTPLSSGSHTFLFWGNDLSGSGTTVINIQMIVMEWQR